MGGLTENQEAEGRDRERLTWPGVQAQLIAKLAEAAKSPITVLVLGGGQIDLSTERDMDNVGALLWIGYPSMHGGRAIADVLFGRFSPSGRTVTTSYPADYTKLSMEDMELRPNSQTANPGRTYKWYTGTPVFPFGYGLSYSTFSYEWLSTARSTENIQHWSERTVAWATENEVSDASSAPFVSYSCNVTNTGQATSDISVLLFVSSTAPDTPQQQLIGYTHIHQLQPAHSHTVYFDVALNSLLQVDDMGDRYMQPAEYTVFIGHAGHRELSHTFTMEGERTLIQQWPRRPTQQQQHSEKKQVAGENRHNERQ